MKKFILALILLSALYSCAQSTLKSTGSLSAACTNATTTCDATANSQLKLAVGEYSMASITFHGTFTGVTVFFEFSDDGGTNWYPSTCTRNDVAIQENSEALTDSTNRSLDCGTAGAGMFRIRLHAISSGTLLVGASQSAIQVEPAPTVSLSGQAPAIALSASGSIQTAITASATGAASAANTTLAAAAAKTTYITGFQITGGGATAASVINVTVTGTITGTMNYNIPVPAGATLGITPLVVSFPVPVPASAVNTAIVVNVPSFGAGNTASAVSAQGFQQ